MFHLEAVSAQRLYRLIAERIAQKIRAGGFPVGSRLPAERELAELLQVSRSSVREALIALELSGYVEVRVGSGVYVTTARGPGMPALAASGNAPGVADSASGIGPFELLQARLLIEPECAAYAACKGTQGQRAKVRQAQRALSDAGAGKHLDRAFHAAIAAACGNAALEAVVLHLWNLAEASPVYERLRPDFVDPKGWGRGYGKQNPRRRPATPAPGGGGASGLAQPMARRPRRGPRPFHLSWSRYDDQLPALPQATGQCRYRASGAGAGALHGRQPRSVGARGQSVRGRNAGSHGCRGVDARAWPGQRAHRAAGPGAGAPAPLFPGLLRRRRSLQPAGDPRWRAWRALRPVQWAPGCGPAPAPGGVGPGPPHARGRGRGGGWRGGGGATGRGASSARWRPSRPCAHSVSSRPARSGSTGFWRRNAPATEPSPRSWRCAQQRPEQRPGR